ncbi:MAG: histidine kinase [Pseudomonadota bacterium]
MSLQLAPLFRDRTRLFWVLNVTGWTGYVLAAYLGALAHEKPDRYFIVILGTATLGFALTLLMRPAFRALWPRPPAVIAVGMLGMCYSMALVWRFIQNQLYFDVIKGGWQPSHWADYFGGVLGSFYILLCWTGLYFGIKYYQRLQDQTEQTLKATAAAHQAQLKMLRYQLHPHFLFNTLNAISTLILDSRNELANQSVTRLSRFLRFTLDNDPMKRVTLRKELEAVDLYLEIERVRFGERLTIRRDIESGALDALVPSLILQPLVENAIKYAVTPREEGGTLALGARVQAGQLVLTLADDGPGLSAAPNGGNGSCGVGLKNTRERLRQLYNDQQALTLAPNDPRGLVATINLPLDPGVANDG